MLILTFIKSYTIFRCVLPNDSFQLLTAVFSTHRLNGAWAEVESCTGITSCYCDLSSLIPDYSAVYKVQIQLVAGDDTSLWTVKRVRLYESKHGCYFGVIGQCGFV